MDYLQTEIEIIDHLQHPHLFDYGSMSEKKNIAYQILNNYKNEEIFIVDPYGFSTTSVFAGLSEKSIELIAQKGPADYKRNILSLLKNTAAIKEVLEIAKLMDDDLGNNSTKNQERIQNVIKYISDNKIVFEF